jgi:hypothetical protein
MAKYTRLVKLNWDPEHWRKYTDIQYRDYKKDVVDEKPIQILGTDTKNINKRC